MFHEENDIEEEYNMKRNIFHAVCGGTLGGLCLPQSRKKHSPFSSFIAGFFICHSPNGCETLSGCKLHMLFPWTVVSVVDKLAPGC